VTELFRLDGKVALVTGSSRGLGAGMAIALASAGADVALHANERSASVTADQIAASSGRRTALLTGDLADRSAAEALVTGTVDAFGRLDILVNNAGIIRRRAAVEHTDEEWDAVLAVNLSSVFRLCRAAGRHMIGRGSGKIVNIASMLSFQGGVTVPGYAASKGGVKLFMQSVAQELAPHRIRVNSIAPGAIQTPINRAAWETPQALQSLLTLIPYGRIGLPEDVGRTAVWLISDAADYVHGQTIFVDGGMTLYPEFARGG